MFRPVGIRMIARLEPARRLREVVQAYAPEENLMT